MENTYAAKTETTCTEWGSSESAWAPAHYWFEILPSNGYKRILLLTVLCDEIYPARVGYPCTGKDSPWRWSIYGQQWSTET